jgi:hypothetical protein
MLSLQTIVVPVRETSGPQSDSLGVSSHIARKTYIYESSREIYYILLAEWVRASIRAGPFLSEECSGPFKCP